MYTLLGQSPSALEMVFVFRSGLKAHHTPNPIGTRSVWMYSYSTRLNFFPDVFEVYHFRSTYGLLEPRVSRNLLSIKTIGLLTNRTNKIEILNLNWERCFYEPIETYFDYNLYEFFQWYTTTYYLNMYKGHARFPKNFTS